MQGDCARQTRKHLFDGLLQFEQFPDHNKLILVVGECRWVRHVSRQIRRARPPTLFDVDRSESDTFPQAGNPLSLTPGTEAGTSFSRKRILRVRDCCTLLYSVARRTTTVMESSLMRPE